MHTTSIIYLVLSFLGAVARRAEVLGAGRVYSIENDPPPPPYDPQNWPILGVLGGYPQKGPKMAILGGTPKNP